MSDYSKTTNFTAKDALSTGDPLKLIQGSTMDTEFDAIAVAVATKYDSNDLASVAQAEAGTDATVLMSPDRVQDWADANGGMVGFIQALADPNADQLLGWDDSAEAVIGFTAGTNLAFSGTTLTAPTATLEAAINHDNLTGFVANEHLDWSADQGATNIDVGNVVEGAVTQHEAALSIAKSQFSDLATVTQVAAEAGTATDDKLWTAERVSQAIAALVKGNVKGAKVHDASTQSITTTTWTAINFDSEAYDTNSFHDTVTNNTRITIPAGVTRIRLTGHVEFPSNGSGIRRIKLRKNGSDGAIDDAMSTYQPFEYRSASGASGVPISMGIDSGIITVAENDYFELLCYQTSATTLAIPARDSWFQIEELA